MRTGTNIGHYRVGDRIGQGGMGEVYQAVDTRLDRPVALKFLAARYVSDPEAKARFIREAKSASALDHPNICTIHDIGEAADGELYIVMALYEGETLDRRMKREPFSAERTVRIVRQVAEALKRAHASGIVHRDVKPANIMVGEDDAVRLLDFGIAKLQSGETLTQTGMSLGTAVYMSPEQAVGDPVTPASDVWSLGLVAYEMLTGRHPFKADQPLAVLHKIASVDPEPVGEVRDDVPAALTEVIHQALEKQVGNRFADAAELLAALDGATEGAPAIGRAADSPRARARLAIAAAGLMLVAVLVVVYWARRPAPAPVTGYPRDVVAILPFAYTGPEDMAWVEEGLMDLVDGRLDNPGTLRTLDTRAVANRVAQKPDASIDARRGRELAMELGAGRFVLGSVVGTAGRLDIRARLYDVDPDAPEPELVSVGGAADSLFTVADRLASGLLETSFSGANARIQRNAARSSGSIEATKEFLSGEQFHRRGQFDSAAAAYNRALALDSTFALAHLMKSMNNAYTYETDDYAAAESALRFSEGLPDRDRFLIEAFRDMQAGRLEEATQGYTQLLRRYPDEVKALLMMGMMVQRSNPRWARPMDEARPYFARALELEPENVQALHNLARIDAGTGRFDSLPKRAAALDRVAHGSEWAVDAETMRAFALNDTFAIRELEDSYPSQSLLVRLYAAYNAMRFAEDPREADTLLARLGSGPVNPATGIPQSYAVDTDLSVGIQVLSYLLGGRYNDVRAFLTDPARTHTPTWDAWDAELIVSDVVPVDRSVKEHVLTRLRASDPEERLRTVFEALHDIFTPAVMELERDVNVAKLLGRLGRMDEAWQIQRRLADLPPFTAFESLNRDAAGGLAADLYVLEGDSARALDILRALPYQLPLTAGSLSITTASHARFLRAELEMALPQGDREAARYLYAGMVQGFTPPDKLFLASAYERLGRIHEDAGRTDEVIYFYERLLAAWVDADPELHARREAVRQRLEALRGGDRAH